MQPLSRRQFFRTGAAFALGAVAVACGRESPNQRKTGTFDQVLAGRAQTMQLLLPGFEALSGIDERLVAALFTSDQTQLTGGSGQVWVALGRSEQALGPFPLSYRGEGLADRGVYVAPIRFPQDGVYTVLVEAQPSGASQTLVGVGTLKVGKQNEMPKQGGKAVSVATPTPDRPRGVDPYCTAKPPCSMHAVSLDRALQSGKPTIVIIATPAYCQSRLCGPEVEMLQAIAGETGDRANFIHIEVYANDKPETITAMSPLSPAAAAWNLREEPAVYWIDRAGTIAQRYVGPVDRSELREQTSKLLAS